MRFLSTASGMALLILNLLAWGGTFYRKIVIEKITAFGMWPAAIAVPGIAALCLVGYYCIERGHSDQDRIAGYAISLGFLAIGIAGVLGY
jgi:hypothetical protein